MVVSMLIYGVLTLYAVSRIWVLMQAKKVDKRLSRQYTLIMPLSILARILPKIWLNPGQKLSWRERGKLYDNTPLKSKTIVPLFHGVELVYSANIATFRQVLGNNNSFIKHDSAIVDFQFLGVNVIASVGEVWKRHRRITAPAFNHTTYHNVWTTTARVYQNMIESEGWSNAKEARIADANTITHKLALFVISIVSFGIPMTWDMADRDEEGRLTVQGMVFRVSQSILLRSRTPKWAYKLGIKRLNECDEAFTTFEKFMMDCIASKEDELRKLRTLEEGDGDISEGIKDVFGRLVNARLSDGKLALSNSEIIGNCFMFAFAGHETTAYTLSATLALLAASPEAQEWVHSSIKSVLGDREPTFDDFDALEDVLACFYETLRMFPAAYVIMRKASSDTVLRIPRTDNPNIIEEVPVRKGSGIILDVVGMGYDSRVFKDPESFQPWRWSKARTLEAESTITDKSASEVPTTGEATSLEGFTAFSYGPRTCLGHKFAKIEAVAFLTHLIKDWKIEPDLRIGETLKEWRYRVLADPGFALTITFKDISVKLVRRN